MKLRIAVLAVAGCVLVPPSLHAKVTPEEAATLGTTLTPVGAEKAGNKEATIPDWKPYAKRNVPLKGYYPEDPVLDAQQPIFTINKTNMAQYANQLTAGHQYLLKTYDSYKMKVYPSTRDITWPDTIIKSTAENAVKCEIIGSDILDNCKLGFPFPIPKTGAEPVWNHKLKWRGNEVRRVNNQIIVQPSGQYQITKIVEDVTFSYSNIGSPVPLTKSSGEFLKYLSETTSPPRLAGTFILVHEKAGTGAEGRAAWLYSPALRRIRRAPTVCCDNPYEGTDGHQFYDQVDMFNGVLERYNWKLIGKKEMFVGYHGNRLGGPQTKYKDMASPKHLNSDLPRYELHRMWVVEATIKNGTSHTFKKRVMYIDEDAWNIMAVDAYDNRDQLYQFQEGHLSVQPSIQASSTVPEVIYHFTSGRYFITAMANEDQPNDFTMKFAQDYFTSAAVQKRTKR